MQELYYNGRKIFMDNGYPSVYYPEHHLAKQNGTVRVHILVMEERLQRPLSSRECVHHKDRNRTNYSIDNLMCFKTNADHVAYHHGAQAFLLDDGTYTCEKIKKGTGKCIECGAIITKYATRCRKCNQTEASIIKNNEMMEQLKSFVIEGDVKGAAKAFSVNEQTIRKWRRRYDLPKPETNTNIDVMSFIEYLKEHSILNTASQFGLTKDTIRSFMKREGIIVENEMVKCVEAATCYPDAHCAARAIRYGKSVSTTAYYIKQSAKKHKLYAGYHWEIIPKKVYIKK